MKLAVGSWWPSDENSRERLVLIPSVECVGLFQVLRGSQDSQLDLHLVWDTNYWC